MVLQIADGKEKELLMARQTLQNETAELASDRFKMSSLDQKIAKLERVQQVVNTTAQVSNNEEVLMA